MGCVVRVTAAGRPHDGVHRGFGLVAAGPVPAVLGTAGKCYLLPGARIAMHQRAVSIGVAVTDIAIQPAVFGKMKRRIAEITAWQTGRSVQRITADADRDRRFDAEEASAYGFVGGSEQAATA
jgi:ATP-dependent Clp protease protease subunit